LHAAARGERLVVRALVGELEKAKEDLIAAMRAAHEEGVPIARIAREAGVSRPTAYDWIRQN